MARMIELTMVLHHETDRAVLVSDDGDKTRATWLPKSQVAIAPTGKVCQQRIGGEKFPVVEIELPEWLATEKGLV